MNTTVDGGTVNFENSKCPFGLHGVWKEANTLEIGLALKKKDDWENQLKSWLTTANEKDQHDIWSFFWDGIGDPQSLNNYSVLLFLLYSCREVYSVRWVFAKPSESPKKLMSAVRLLALELNRIENNAAGLVVAEIIKSASRGIQNYVNNVPAILPLITSDCKWEMGGGLMLLNDQVSIDLKDLLDRVRTAEDFEYLRLCLGDAKDELSREHFRSICQDAIKKKWPDIRKGLLDKWLDKANSRPEAKTGNEFIQFYSVAGYDELYYKVAREKIAEMLQRHRNRQHLDSTALQLWCDMMQSPLCSQHDTDRTLLEIVRQQGVDAQREGVLQGIVDRILQDRHGKDNSLLISLIWIEYKYFRGGHEDDWWVNSFSKSVSILEDRLSTGSLETEILFIIEQFDELAQQFHRFTPDEHHAWRIQLADYVYPRTHLHSAVVELLLWFSNDQMIDDAELVILDILRRGMNKDLISGLYKHPSSLVQRRAKAIQMITDETKYTSTSEIDPRQRSTLLETVNQLHRGTDRSELRHTWLGNRELEHLFMRTIAKVEQTLCTDYSTRWKIDEEQLTARLLTLMEEEFKYLKHTLYDLVRHGLVDPTRIEMKYRQISKQEEGGKGIGTETFGVDLAFIVRVEHKGKLITERASLVQCKKLSHSKHEIGWEASFKIPVTQRDDLIKQSESSFYLLIVPPMVQVECWVVQARLLRSLMKLSQSKATFQKASAYNASRSLAEWMTYDVLGLWMGDERKEVIKAAKGLEPGKEPYALVEITVGLGDEERNV